jgi:CheY-like chemotaxis protein
VARVRLILRPSPEGKERIAALRAGGHVVHAAPVSGPAALRALVKNPPDVVVIDLDRAPSHGRDVALALRRDRLGRGVPIVFAGGDPEKVAALRALLPDAVYASWGRVAAAVVRAAAHPPRDPVVPASALAGYAGTPLPRKLGIKPGMTVALAGAPPGFEVTVGGLPEGASFRRASAPAPPLALWFVRNRRDLTRGIARAAAGIGAGKLWIVWPKKSSGIASDLVQQDVRDVGLAAGLVDFKICAVDETWSGLLFSRRRKR